jgi:VWFA-related protein
MKKIMLLIIILICAALAAQLGQEPAQKEQEIEYKPIVEKVTVTNIEVPVRVLYKNKPVINLSKEDFMVYEDNKKMEINGFFLKRKKLKGTVLSEVTLKKSPLPPRTFVLVFSITDFNEHIKRAVEHLYENIFRPNDQLLIFANDKTLRYANLENKDESKRQLLSDLKKESYKVRRRLIKYINKIETSLNMHDFRRRFYIRRDIRPLRLIAFLKKYLLIWNDYKQKYLTPPVDRFYYFSRYLEEVKTEKWVFNFYQFDLFPKINLDSQTMNKIREISSQLINSREADLHSMGRLINTLLTQLMVDLNVNSSFPTEDIAKLFYKVDAAFHSFFIKNMVRISMNDLEYEEVASNIEKTLKEITDITGGKNITSNNLVKSINTISELEDVYYILTYVPHNPEKAGKLRIKVKNKKYRVLYDNNFRADYISEYTQKLEEKIKVPEIKIENFSFQGKVLAFTITDYMMKETSRDPVGRMKVRIRLTDSNELLMLYDQEKICTAKNNEIKVSLGAFKRITRGEYHFFIDATDLFTGKQANIHQNIIVRR